MTAARAGRAVGWLPLAVAVSLLASLTPWGAILLYPFKLFTTWVHECGHALAAVLVGGRVSAITIAPDTSGLTMSLVPDARLPRAVVASAGYLGAAIVGCLLLAAARVERHAPRILHGIGLLMLATLVIWMRNLFGAFVVLAWGLTLVAIARHRTAPALRLFLGLLAVQVALNAVYDIRVLFQIDHGPSDAATMASLLFLPASVWAAIWMAISLAMLGGTVWATRRR
jgi:hypothetical protein